MQNKIRYVKIIGYGLATLYAVTLVIFMYFMKSSEHHFINLTYIFLFFLAFIGSLASALMQEWGRKLVIVANAVMLGMMTIKYIPHVDIVPLTYFFMSIIVLLYFNQNKVKLQFVSEKGEQAWKSILIIDDDETLIKSVRPLLISNGYSVLTATTGEAGLKIIEQQKPDMVILDVILPGIKGRELCKLIKTDPNTKHIPVVFLTAKASQDDIKAEMDAGATIHITKPFQPKALVKTVREVFEGS